MKRALYLLPFIVISSSLFSMEEGNKRVHVSELVENFTSFEETEFKNQCFGREENINRYITDEEKKTRNSTYLSKLIMHGTFAAGGTLATLYGLFGLTQNIDSTASDISSISASTFSKKNPEIGFLATLAFLPFRIGISAFYALPQTCLITVGGILGGIGIYNVSNYYSMNFEKRKKARLQHLNNVKLKVAQQ